MKLSFPKSNAIYVISDIHGGLELLEELVTFVDKDSYLFIIGDIFEKGIKSLETLRYVIELSKKPNVFVIKGNNDVALLKCLQPKYSRHFARRMKKPNSIIYQMVQLVTAETSIPLLQLALKEYFSEEITWLEALDYAIELDDFLFVHAGIDKNGFLESDIETILGIDNFYELGHNDNRIVVCGHYPTAMYNYDKYDNSVLIDEDKKIICIDGGYGATNLGQLNLLKIIKGKNEFSYQTYTSDYYQTATVTKRTEGFGKQRGICFPDYQLKILKKAQYFTLVKVINTNEICKIKNELITYVDNLPYAIDDCPHNHLSVEVGDEVKVIWDQFAGYNLIKINGECGWVNKKCFEEVEK